MIKMYRIKHIPTGLYYQPKKGRWARNKSHFHKEGKVYHKKPDFRNFCTRLCISKTLNNVYNIGTEDCYSNYIVPWVESDWEIEEIKVIEK